MAGFVELFTRYVDQVGSDPVKGAADRVRSDTSRPAADRAALARDIERINGVLGLGPGGDRS